MEQMAQQPVLNMEISDSCVYTQHLVGGVEVMISLIDLGPSRGLVATGVEHRGECCNWRVVEEINYMVGASCLIFYVEMELLQVCGPLLMEVILKFSLCLHEF
jgi:hypothetical protein